MTTPSAAPKAAAAKAKIPAWVADQIALTTGLDPFTLSRACKRTRCHRCHALTYRGLDADRCAFDVTVDRQPLSAVGEALALVAGLLTYERHNEGARYVLDQRDDVYITARPAGTTHRNDVHAEHRCGWQWPPAARAPTSFPDLSRPACVNDFPF